MNEILTRDAVVAAGTATTREGAILEAGGILVGRGAVQADYVDSMLKRESTVSTYMGNLLAIPHGTNEAKDAIVRSAISLVRYARPIDWGGEPVRFVLGIAGLNNEHLDILAKVAVLFSDEDDVQRLAEAADADELFRQLSEVNAG
jgi:Mannitol/fructose-specific phosphotransferase system, IIA domain